MATVTGLSKFLYTSDAEFRIWAQMIHDALVTTCTWVNTADTGQVDLSTMTVSAGANVKVGYKIYRMADALQATTPIYMKVYYGSGATNIPAIHVSFGTGTNGAGTLTGTTVAEFIVGPQTAPTAGSPDGSGNYNHLFSGSTSSFGMITSDNAVGTSQAYFFVERTKDTAGEDTTDGIIFTWWHYTASTSGSGCLRPALSISKKHVFSSLHNTGFLVPVTGTGQKGADVVTYPYYVHGPEMLNPGIMGMATFEADMGAGNATVTHYGTARTYKFTGNPAPDPSLYGSGVALRLGILWE